MIIKVMVGTVLATGDEVMTLNLYFSQVKNESVQIFEIDQKQNVRDSWNVIIVIHILFLTVILAAFTRQT